jgi:hypothetical protein
MSVALTSGSCGRWRAGPFFEVVQAAKFHGFVLMKSQSAPAPHSRGVRRMQNEPVRSHVAAGAPPNFELQLTKAP